MPKGISIHIGLNQVDQSHYLDARVLQGCVNDAQAMQALAQAAGFTVGAFLVDAQATVPAVTAAIQAAAQSLTDGDTLLVTYSGHGGSVIDSNNDEGDGYDETWCLYDRQMLDDELYELWSQFGAGVRILVISDSCNSGTVTKSLTQDLGRVFGAIPEGTVEGTFSRSAQEIVDSTAESSPQQPATFRALGANLARQVNQTWAALYASIQSAIQHGRNAPLQASVLLLGASQDGKPSQDGTGNGVFTRALLDAWSKPDAIATYLELHKAIYDRIHFSQEPSYYKVGVPSPEFELEKPFTIG